MTLRTPEQILNCVKSNVFADVELTHDWTLQPPLPAYLDIHRSISVCSCCDASLNEEYAGNALFRAFLTCADGTHVYWRTNGDGNSGVIGAQLCKWPSAQRAIISSTPGVGPRRLLRSRIRREALARPPPCAAPRSSDSSAFPRKSRPADQQCSSTDAGCQDIETCQSLRGVCFIRRRQLGYHKCTAVQMALCTHSHHIEHPGVGPRRLLRS